MPEAIVVGAGVVGASIAFHLAERGIETLVLDRNGPAGGSTARSGALVRCHYPTPLEADLAWESLTEYFEPWGERIGGGCGFTRTGFAYLAGEDRIEALHHNVNLQQRVNVQTSLVEPEGLRELEPSLDLDGVALAAYEPRGGYADPTATTVGFLEAAGRLGARFEHRRVTGLLGRGEKIAGVEMGEGPLEAGIVVLAAGVWSVPLAAGVGLELPVCPVRVQVALFERPYTLPTHLTIIDSVSGFYARPAAERATLIGLRDSYEWLEDAEGWAPGADTDFVNEASRLLGKRIPALKGAPYLAGRAGVLDMTPDGRPILGPEGPEGLYLAAGWSGTGFKKAPAVGKELATWIQEGRPNRRELETYSLDPLRHRRPRLRDARTRRQESALGRSGCIAASRKKARSDFIASESVPSGHAWKATGILNRGRVSPSFSSRFFGTGSPAVCTNATGRSPNSVSGTGTTTAPSTPSTRSSAASISSGWMFSPPEIKRLSRRPHRRRTRPSSSPRSPVWNHPSASSARSTSPPSA